MKRLLALGYWVAPAVILFLSLTPWVYLWGVSRSVPELPLDQEQLETAKGVYDYLEQVGDFSNRTDRLHFPGKTFRTQASWYGPGFHGRRAASGEVYDQWAQVVASPDLPFGKWLKIRNLSNGKIAIAKVVDRGPYGTKGRELDCSLWVAYQLGFKDAGVAEVEVEVLRGER